MINMSFCSVDGCEKKAIVKGMCKYHYEITVHSDKECSAEGCTSPQYMGGYCQRHYRQIRRHGEVREVHFDKCLVEDCEHTNRLVKGYCPMHRAQLKKHGSIQPKKAVVCTVEGCNAPVKFRGLCADHYRECRVEETREYRHQKYLESKEIKNASNC